MDAPTAAAIGSLCTLALGVLTLAVQFFMALRLGKTHALVNSQSEALKAVIAQAAYARGQLAGPSDVGVAGGRRLDG